MLNRKGKKVDFFFALSLFSLRKVVEEERNSLFNF